MTHPAMHMMQHQTGAAIGVDVVRFNDLVKENGVLARALGKAQERCSRLIAEQSAEIERVHARLEQFRTRQAELETLNTQLRQQLGEAHHALSMHAQEDAVKLTRQEPSSETPITVHLHQKTVLCVGGHNGNVTNYRNVIEQAGGFFAHHDGGLADNQSALDASLVSADLVICQTGCMSHNAYWRVKDFCKRTGKQCVFVENPSTSSLTRSLQQIAGDDRAIKRNENQIAS